MPTPRLIPVDEMSLNRATLANLKLLLRSRLCWRISAVVLVAIVVVETVILVP